MNWQVGCLPLAPPETHNDYMGTESENIRDIFRDLYIWLLRLLNGNESDGQCKSHRRHGHNP